MLHLFLLYGHLARDYAEEIKKMAQVLEGSLSSWQAPVRSTGTSLSIDREGRSGHDSELT